MPGVLRAAKRKAARSCKSFVEFVFKIPCSATIYAIGAEIKGRVIESCRLLHDDFGELRLGPDGAGIIKSAAVKLMRVAPKNRPLTRRAVGPGSIPSS